MVCARLHWATGVVCGLCKKTSWVIQDILAAFTHGTHGTFNP
jgi:hypothetical protein